MKIKFLLLSLGLFVFSAVIAQKKTNTVKTSKTTTTAKTNSNNPLYQQTETQVVTTKTTASTAPVKAETIEDKYQMIIDQNLSSIQEIDKKLADKKNAYSKDEKLKNNNAVLSELKSARFQMIAEIIGPDAANYYIKNH